MSAVPSSPAPSGTRDVNLDDLISQIDSKPVFHLPVVGAVVDALHITEVIDELCPQDPRARVSDAACVKLMVLNILQGRVALYRMDRWLDRTDPEVLLGPGCAADAFSDARLAAALDHLYEAGTDEVFTGVMVRYLQDWQAATGTSDLTLHQDTTSISVYGEYSGLDDNFGPTPMLGFSKDHRPDLKQLIFGLTLHGATAMPLFGTMLDGNYPDGRANRLHVQSLAELLPEDGEVTVVGDCKLVDTFTLEHLASHGWHFVSLVPNTFAVRRALIERVRDEGIELPLLWEGPGRHKGEVRRYHGASFEVPLTQEGEQAYRHLVVRSDQLLGQFERALPDKLTKEAVRVDKAVRKLAVKGFSCREDAEAAVGRVMDKVRLHRVEVAYEAQEVKLKRSRPGRPRKGEVTPTATVWRPRRVAVEPDDALIEQERLIAGHFVLVTDHLDRETWPDERILAEYRHQHAVEGHTGFRWLKNDAAVAPVFLKKPHRIAALGMVMLLALAVRNYIQYQLRTRLEATGRAVDDRKGRPTARPTTETAFLGFDGVLLLRVVDGGRVLQRRAQGVDGHCRTVLDMLGLTEDILTSPPAIRKPSPSAAGP